MKTEEILNELERISWGAKFISAKDSHGRENFFIIKSLSLRDKNWISFIYNKAIEEGKEKGLLTNDELMSYYIRVGLWSKQKEFRIVELKEDIAKLEEAKKNKDLDRQDKKRLTALLSGALRALNRLIQEKTEKFCMSLERYASERKIGAVIFSCTYKENNTKLWDSWEDFEQELDRSLIDNIMSKSFGSPQLTEKEIRSMARSPVWRYKWTAAKACDDLFGKPITELDTEQEALVYWSQIYDSVYEAYERPTQDIIDNDDALDKWFKNQSQKKKSKEVSAGKSSDKYGVSNKIGKHAEVFIVANKQINPDAPEIGDIWDLNSDGNKRFIKIEREKLKNNSALKEQQMRPDRNTRMVAGAQRAEFEIRRGKKNVTRLHDY